MGLFSSKIQKGACDVCQQNDYKKFRSVGKHLYETCQNCGTIILKTRQLNIDTPPDTYLEDVDQYLSIISPEGTRYMAGNVDHYYQEKIDDQKGDLLEIGSGVGMLAYTLFSRGWEVDTMELSKVASEWQDKVFKLKSFNKPLESHNSGKKYNAVVLVEVVEHFYDPLANLKQIKKLLKKPGMIFGTTPNIKSLHWSNSEQDIYDPTDHIVLFNRNSLKAILQKAGFKDITIEYFGMGDKHDSNLMYSAKK